jgi:hypothetical protein
VKGGERVENVEGLRMLRGVRVENVERVGLILI